MKRFISLIDITGKEPFLKESLDKDNNLLPEGWKWDKDSVWTVDLFGKHGQVDLEGLDR